MPGVIPTTGPLNGYNAALAGQDHRRGRRRRGAPIVLAHRHHGLSAGSWHMRPSMRRWTTWVRVVEMRQASHRKLPRWWASPASGGPPKHEPLGQHNQDPLCSPSQSGPCVPSGRRLVWHSRPLKVDPRSTGRMPSAVDLSSLTSARRSPYANANSPALRSMRIDIEGGLGCSSVRSLGNRAAPRDASSWRSAVLTPTMVRGWSVSHRRRTRRLRRPYSGRSSGGGGRRSSWWGGSACRAAIWTSRS